MSFNVMLDAEAFPHTLYGMLFGAYTIILALLVSGCGFYDVEYVTMDTGDSADTGSGIATDITSDSVVGREDETDESTSIVDSEADSSTDTVTVAGSDSWTDTHTLSTLDTGSTQDTAIDTMTDSQSLPLDTVDSETGSTSDYGYDTATETTTFSDTVFFDTQTMMDTETDRDTFGDSAATTDSETERDTNSSTETDTETGTASDTDTDTDTTPVLPSDCDGVPYAIIHDFSANTSGWILSSDEPLPLSLTWTSTAGDPVASGVAQIDAELTSEIIYFRYAMSSTDFTDATVGMRLFVAAGDNVGVKVYLQTGTTYEWADSGFYMLPSNTWVCVQLDVMAPFYETGSYNPIEAIRVGLEISAAGPFTLYVDDVRY